MSEQAAASNTPPTSGPTPCKMGCGFFGSSATGDCCSKCWATVNKKSSANAATPSCLPVSSSTTSAAQPAPVAKQQPPPTDAEKPQPMEIDETKPAEAAVTASAAPAQTTPKKKKKKKTSYKNMMAGMMKESSPTRDTKDKLKHVTGGGAFSKIDKI